MEIKIKDLNFTYHKIGYTSNKVLKDINMNIKIGEITSIIGESTTSLLEVINGNLEYTGTITLNDKPLSKIGYASQEPQFLNTTVKEELKSILILNDYKLDDIDKRILDSLVMVGLNNNYLNRNINTLSSSEIKKLSLSCTLISNPKIILLDDPTDNLDELDKINLIKLIKLLKKRYNKTFIIASNDTDFLNVISDYIFVIHNKEVVLQGNKYEVFKQEKLLNKYNIRQPKVIEFSSRVLDKKNIKIGYRDEINDLIKDIYRFK